MFVVMALVGCGEKATLEPKENVGAPSTPTTQKTPAKPDDKPNPKPEVKQSGAPKTDKKKDEELAWTSNPEDKNYALIEMYIRMKLDKRKGDLSKMDLEKMTVLTVYEGESLEDLKPLSKLTKLKRLRLDGTQVSDLSPLANLTQLERLELIGGQISDVSALANLKKLEYIDLRNNFKLNKDKIALLQKALPNCFISHDHPTDLEIIEGKVRMELDKFAVELTKLDLAKVNMIVFDEHEITDTSALTDLAKLTQLKTLGIPNNGLSDLGFLKGLTQLEHLDLQSNKITDLSPLAKLTKLKYIDLSSNPSLTKAQIEKLQKALPKCEISHNAK